ncbi:MAG TPA: hypothetical protein VMS64_25005, partial [Candidatus Methylomirabilis sp.]|nr:hypothetical protein [Candidatus Methylomirabilis sp.]
LAVANHEHTTDLEARTGTIMAGLRSSQQRAKTLLDLVVEEGEAKMRLLERKVADARGRRRALLNARLAEIRIRYRNRAEKLRATWVRAEQALARA